MISGNVGPLILMVAAVAAAALWLRPGRLVQITLYPVIGVVLVMAMIAMLQE